MKRLIDIAWQRFSINSAIVGDINGRFIATLFYFTILTPFGLLSTLFMDPLRRKSRESRWLERPPLPDDIASAKQQG